jgi:hypothetical protein
MNLPKNWVCADFMNLPINWVCADFMNLPINLVCADFMNLPTNIMFSGFRHEVRVYEKCVLLGYYGVRSGNFLPTFRDKLSVESLKSLKMGPIGCLGFASPCVLIHLSESTNLNAANSQVYYLSFKYSSTYFGHPHAHHQELHQLQ